MRRALSHLCEARLSYEGRIQVVAEITGHTRYDIAGKARWALSGNALRPGDPVHDTLKGSPVRRRGNPVSYFDTSSLESLTAGERASFDSRDRATMVVTWNPEKWNPDDWETWGYPEEVDAVAAGGLLRSQWATGPRKSGIEPGDRVFFLRQGPEPRGVIGSGTASSRIFTDVHWNDERSDETNYVLIEWDTLLLAADGLSHASLVEQIPEGGIWRPQASGWVLRPDVAADLEMLWTQHLGRAEPLPPRASPCKPPPVVRTG